MFNNIDYINNLQNELSYVSILQQEKENYITNMLIRTLYSNDVDNAECYRIIKSFKDKVLGNVTIS